jgi:hypothetical protein
MSSAFIIVTRLTPGSPCTPMPSSISLSPSSKRGGDSSLRRGSISGTGSLG